MLTSNNKFKKADTINISSNRIDTIDVKKIIEKDSIISGKEFIEYLKDSDAAAEDSIAATPKTEIADSISSGSDTTEVKQKVVRKYVKHQPSDTIKLHKDVYPSSDSAQLTRNKRENFLVNVRTNDTLYPRNIVLKTLSNKLTTGYNNKNIAPIKRNESSNDFFLGIIIFIILLILWIKIFYRKYFTILLNSLFSYQVSVKLFREKNVLIKRVSFALNFIYVIVLAIFILKILEFYQIKVFNFNTIETLLFLINLIVIISIARIFLLSIIGFLFNNIEVFNEYIHNNYIINKNLGLILFLLLIIQIYMTENITKVLIITGIIFIILSHIIRLYRGFQIIIKKDIFLFYLILYLCTLEILPLLLGYKFFISLI